MNVEQLMSRDSRECTPDQTLDCAAQIMWERDCGIVPVVDGERRVIGMITDRDICMAAYTKHQRLDEIAIGSVALKPVAAVRPSDSAETAESMMRRHQLRRLAVVDDARHLVGMLSLNDLARRAGTHPELAGDAIANTLAAISQPRANGSPRART